MWVERIRDTGTCYWCRLYGAKLNRTVVDTQMHDIIASSDAWTITDEAIDEDDGAMDGQRPTVSARQVKALIEQVTGASYYHSTPIIIVDASPLTSHPQS